jgi:metal-responsive CopG/Arc/MetJ family transcriptional regulator
MRCMRQDTQIAVRISRTLLEALDGLRREEVDVPSRAEMIRRLIQRATRIGSVENSASVNFKGSVPNGERAKNALGITGS